MRSLYPLLLCLVFVPAAAVHADVLTLPRADSTKPSFRMPTRGMTMQQVEAQFGQPREKLPAVGEPPITRWRYDRYSVYFERRHVIHSVRHGKR